MSKTLIAIVLIALGGVLLYLGSQRKDSIAGHAQSAGQEVASTFDGKPRVTDHTLYFVGGGALILVGIVVALRRAG
ncbi:hypothetical protein DB347_01130 [Opitutaceae bacterium EW11]|nr:hypothetical protein DB347_01130 [Opitutaceae bacterium EW11]